MIWLTSNQRPPFPHLRPLLDLTRIPDTADQLIAEATQFFGLDEDTIFSGVARERDIHDREAPLYIQVWHGERLYRTMAMPSYYVGVLNAQIPGDIQVEKYLSQDRIGDLCAHIGSRELATACIGKVHCGNIIVQVPELSP